MLTANKSEPEVHPTYAVKERDVSISLHPLPSYENQRFIYALIGGLPL